ncbi:hypothetical protein IQ257_16115 [Coleofasciculus sp. LEGE 07092]|nr:hypothetical protein [Coleofasciculus sp. LEGE 07081]MBE9150000.1 hypothetical protein [Coleofasciculus sp. LEGE 07092]
MKQYIAEWNASTYITRLLEQLTVDYKNTKEERKKIGSLFPTSDEEFTLLEEIELLTVDIRGYASQIQTRGWIENEQDAIKQLQDRRIFSVPAIAQFYFATNGDYRQLKAYIQMLDYLRLLMLEYLHSTNRTTQDSIHQRSQPKSSQGE